MRFAKKRVPLFRVFSFILTLALCVVWLSAFSTAVSAGAGDLMSTAVNASYDKTYTKTWNKDTDHLNHYVKFTVSKRGVVTVVASKPFDDDSEYGSLYFTFYDKNGNAFFDNHTYKAADNAKSEYTIKAGLNPGTYYMTLKPGFTVQSGTIVTNYKLSFKADSYCEVEENESAATATAIKMNQKYTAWYGADSGQHGYNDYFKFPVEAGRTYEVAFYNYAAIRSEYDVTIFRPDGQELSFIGSGYEKYETAISSDGLNCYRFSVNESGNVYVCVSCGSYTEQFEYGIIARLRLCNSHSFGTWTTTKNATCKETGKKTRACSTCGFEESQTIEKTSHSYDYWTTTKQATCATVGEQTRTCSVCDNKETREVEKVTTHNLGEWTVTKEAACEEAGEREATCADCKKKITESISAKNHSFDDDCDATCANCDYVREPYHYYSQKSDANGHWDECSACGNRTETVAHDPGEEATEYSAQTCRVCSYEIAPAVEADADTDGDGSKKSGGTLLWLLVVAAVAVGGVYVGKKSANQ